MVSAKGFVFGKVTDVAIVIGLIVGAALLAKKFNIGPLVSGSLRGFGQAVGATATADGVDDKRMAIGIVTTPAQSSGGYVTFHRDTYTGVNGVNNFTDVVQPGKLLGVHGFETNSWADELTDGDHRTGSDIQEIAITIDRKDVLGPIYPTTSLKNPL